MNYIEENWKKELFNLSQTCAVPASVDIVPDDAWVNGWFEAFGAVEPFIESTLTTYKQQLREEVEGLRRPTNKGGLIMPVMQYNNAIDDILSLLSDKGV